MRFLAFLAVSLCTPAVASEVYKEKCALCRDAGATGAPRASVDLPPDLPAAAPASAPAAKPYVPFEARVDDATLALSVVQALLGARVGGVQVEARNGRVVLKGVVDDAAAAARAKRAAQSVTGVREIEDRLVSADAFERD